ncbi:phosphomannomutase/phosphoglucomutase [Desulfothermus okinawensis JCM 13304]
MKPINKDVFRAYDIRGIVDKDFDEEWVEVLGKACGTYFQEKGYEKCVVGRDCRHSSPAYQRAMVKGLISTGIDVIILPMVPTPVFYFSVKYLKLNAGVMITASHNPPEFNGFKVWAGLDTIHTTEIESLYEVMKNGKFKKGEGFASEFDPIPIYLEQLARGIKLGNRVKVVVDGGNGTSGNICKELLNRLGCEVHCLYCDPDPDFPNHHPDPTVLENIKDLRQKVVDLNAHLGVGFDGDGDRIGVVDENGNVLYGDQVLAIFAREVLIENPGAKIIGEVKCSHLLYRDIENHGGIPIMWKTGHSLIKAKMREEGALLAGEMSGHMFFADRYYGFDDAIYAAARLIEIISKYPEKRLSTYLEDWPKTYNTPEIRMDCPEKIKFQVVEKAKEYFKAHAQGGRVIDVDGIRINFKDGWGLIRASNTQPVLVLRFEAESEQRLREIQEFFETPLKKWISELNG